MKNKPLEHPSPIPPEYPHIKKVIEVLRDEIDSSIKLTSGEMMGAFMIINKIEALCVPSPIPPVSKCGCVCHQMPVHNCMICDCRKPWKEKPISYFDLPDSEKKKVIKAAAARMEKMKKEQMDWEKSYTQGYRNGRCIMRTDILEEIEKIPVFHANGTLGKYDFVEKEKVISLLKSKV